MNDIIPGTRVEGQRAASTARTSTRPASTSSTCAAASAWCSRSRTRFRSRSSRTSPTASASTGWRGSRPELHGRVEESLQAGGAVGRGEGPAARVRAGALGRPAAAAVHRARAGRQARDPADGRAGLGARPDRHAAHRGADLRAEAATTRSSSSRTTCSRRRASRTTRRSSGSGELVEFGPTDRIFTDPAREADRRLRHRDGSAKPELMDTRRIGISRRNSNSSRPGCSRWAASPRTACARPCEALVERDRDADRRAC